MEIMNYNGSALIHYVKNTGDDVMDRRDALEFLDAIQNTTDVEELDWSSDPEMSHVVEQVTEIVEEDGIALLFDELDIDEKDVLHFLVSYQFIEIEELEEFLLSLSRKTRR